MEPLSPLGPSFFIRIRLGTLVLKLRGPPEINKTQSQQLSQAASTAGKVLPTSDRFPGYTHKKPHSQINKLWSR